MFYITILSYIFAELFIKILLLMMLIRIFSPLRKHVLFIRTLIVFVITYYLTILCVRIFACRPISAFWNRESGSTCINLDDVFTVDSFVALITDGTILILPIVLAWSLHLPLKTKIKIAFVLGAGGLTTLTNVYRLYLVFKYQGTADVSFFMIHLVYTGYVYPFSRRVRYSSLSQDMQYCRDGYWFNLLLSSYYKCSGSSETPLATNADSVHLPLFSRRDRTRCLLVEALKNPLLPPTGKTSSDWRSTGRVVEQEPDDGPPMSNAWLFDWTILLPQYPVSSGSGAFYAVAGISKRWLRL